MHSHNMISLLPSPFGPIRLLEDNKIIIILEGLL